jgi:hypothetical protein
MKRDISKTLRIEYSIASLFNILNEIMLTFYFVLFVTGFAICDFEDRSSSQLSFYIKGVE